MGTKHRGSRREVEALDAFIALMRCSESVLAATSPPYVEEGLTSSQFGTLECLFHLGPLYQRDIARKLLRTGGNVVMVVDNLEKRGLVIRRKDPEDRRCTWVELTDPGRRLIEGLFPRVLEKIVGCLGVLTPKERVELHRLCRKLGRGAAEPGKEG